MRSFISESPSGLEWTKGHIYWTDPSLSSLSSPELLINYFMSCLYSELSKISVSASTSADLKSTLPVIETGTSIKTDGITKLIGDDNYQTWEMQVEYLHISIDAEEIVLENLQPPSDATAEKL
jgi:hypothetical protein